MNFHIEIWKKLQNVSAGHLHKNHYNFFLVNKQACPRLDLSCRTYKRVNYQLFWIRLQIFQNTPLILCIVQNWWDCPQCALCQHVAILIETSSYDSGHSHIWNQKCLIFWGFVEQDWTSLFKNKRIKKGG